MATNAASACLRSSVSGRATACFGAGPPWDGQAQGTKEPDVTILPLRPTAGGDTCFLTIAAVVALVGAGTGTSLALSGTTATGASTPAGAASNCSNALGHSDVIGMLDALAPGERDAIEPGLQNIFDQLKRLGILSAGADLGNLTGLSAQYKDFTATTDQLTPGVAAVTLTGGSVTGSVDPSQVPLGGYFKDFSEPRSTASRKPGHHRQPALSCSAPKRSGVAGT